MGKTGRRIGRLVVRRETGKEQEVQVLYDEDIASQIVPESCEGVGELRPIRSGRDILRRRTGEPLDRRQLTGLPRREKVAAGEGNGR